jgi:negative regulator of flagellin synthesis FlgM
MKIGQPSDIPAALPPTTPAGVAKPGPATGAVASANANAAKSTRSTGVAVSVSQQARALEKSAADVATDIDTQKIAAVRSAIQDGTYVVNPEAIADKLLANAQEMLQRTVQ